MFYCLKFYFNIIYVVSVDEYYNKFKDIIYLFFVLCLFFLSVYRKVNGM